MATVTKRKSTQIETIIGTIVIVIVEYPWLDRKSVV